MQKALERLTQASHKLAEVMYQQGGPEGGAAGPGGAAGGGPAGGPAGGKPGAASDEVIDAEYVDVNDKR